jgi:archaetidylinositol phosphate synthase
MRDINKHKRINDILLGPLERPALQWLVAHMPGWVTPDICTMIGVFGAVIILFSYLLTPINKNYLWFASLGFIINWFGDSLDGTLARYRHIERPNFGFFLDHIVDAINEVLIFIGLGLTPFVHFNIACLTLIAYLLLSILIYVTTCVTGEFKISYGKLGPTEVRVLAILLNMWMYFGAEQTFVMSAGVFGDIAASPYDLFVGFIGLLLLFFFLDTARKVSVKLAKADSHPGSEML